MIYRTTSAARVIAKVYRDLGMTRGDWELSALEWIGEALQHIGAAPELIQRGARLTVADYRTALPLDLVVLDGIFYKEGVTDETFDLASLAKLPRQRAINTLGVTTLERSAYQLNADYYALNPDYILTSFETGLIAVAYRAILIGEDGFPRVPDDPSFIDALFWMIVRQLVMGGYQHPTMKLDFEYCDQKWKYYCTQARNTANMPDPDSYELLAKSWAALTPRLLTGI